MIAYLVAYLGGALTILSPCILPVLPFVFSRADRPFLKNGLPLLAGLGITFTGVAILASVGGGWAVEANRAGRLVALAALALFGLALLLPGLSDRLMRPLVELGARLAGSAEQEGENAVGRSLLLGVATGLLWAPCAGPILGLILTGAALEGASATTALQLLAYAAGAMTSLGLALLAGGKVFALMKRSLGIGEWVRRGLGVAVLASVAAIGLGLDTGILARASLADTARIEESLVAKAEALGPKKPSMMMMAAATEEPPLPVEGQAPALNGAVHWLNSEPLNAEALRGKVVLVDFWTYSCINCLRTLPYVKAWAEKYKDQGLVVIGVHAPEFAFEKDLGNVRKAVADLGITYPVAIDNDYAIWRAFGNKYWPAHYFIDAQGRVRHHHFGEGEYDESERVIQKLLAEAGTRAEAPGLVTVAAAGVEAAPDLGDVRSPETYIGYERAESFASPGGAVPDAPQAYAPGSPRLNEWSLAGDWTVGGENAVLGGKDGGILYRFHARDLHLVLGPQAGDKPVRFKVTVDGAAPGANHGADTDADGQGTVTGDRLYQLVRWNGPVGDHTFEIRFQDPGVRAFAFTFG